MSRSSARRSPASRQTAETSPADAGTPLELLCEGLIEAGWLVMLALAPLFVNSYSARTYEPDKTALVRSIVVVMLAAWLWKVGAGGRTHVPVHSPDPVGTAKPLRGWRGVIGGVLRTPLVPAALLLALCLGVGSVLSVDSRLSWYGSYARSQGAWSQLAYMAVFGLVLAHLRTRSQWLRIAYVLAMTSFLVSLYALLQVLGLDPIPSRVGWSRAFSTLGNPIFLAAYLLMVIFVTVFESLRLAAESRMPSHPGEEQRRLPLRWRVGFAALLGIVFLQVLAVILSQSRGPFLGLLAGGYLFTLVVALIVHRRVRPRRDRAPGPSWLLQWAWLGIIALAVLGLLFLVLFAMPGSPLESLHDVPYLGRLGTILDFESNTAQIRLLIWHATVDLLTSDEPLRGLDGWMDRFPAIRPWIGYGPETFSHAFNRFFPAELARRQDRELVPDRAHNETFDALVMQGCIGYAAWLAVCCGLFHLCLSRLRMIRTRRQRLLFWLSLALGAALGAVAPALLRRNWALSGVGLPAGLIMGLIVYVTLEAILDRAGHAESGSLTARDGLLTAVLATVVAHFVEIHFGMAIVSTRLYFWFLAAVALCLSRDWLSLERPPASVPDPESLSVKKFSKRSASTKRQRRVRPRGERPLRQQQGRWSLFVGLVLGLLGAVLTYGLSLNPARATNGLKALVDGLVARAGGGPSQAPGALFWLILSLGVGICLAWPLQHEPPRARRRLSSGPLLAGLAPGVLYSLLQEARGARVIRLQSDPTTLSEALSTLAHHVTVFVAFTLVMTLVIALSLAWRKGDPALRNSVSSARALAWGGFLVVGAGWWITAADVHPLQADTYLEQAEALLDSKRLELAIDASRVATELAPLEPMNYLILGRVAVAAAKAAETEQQTVRYLELAEDSLSRARQLAPLDPDHAANLARFLVQRADLVENPSLRKKVYQRALAEYEAALALRPGSVLFIDEFAVQLFRMGELNEAQMLLERALGLDPQYPLSLAHLGMIHQQRAADAQRRGDRVAMMRQLEEAVGFYEQAVLLDPGLVTAVTALDRLRPVLERQPMGSTAPTPPPTE